MPLLDNLFSSLNMSKTNPPPPPQSPSPPPSPNPQTSDKGLSFYAFLFSVSVYISIFFIFNLSPSSLFRNTKFWFVISNTLIVIIAADYGSFSSSPRNNLDIYEDYTAKSRTTTPQYMNMAMKSKEVVLDPQENVEDKEMIIVHQEIENPSLEIVVRPDPVKGGESEVLTCESDHVLTQNVMSRTCRRDSEKTVEVSTRESESDVLMAQKAKSRTCRRRNSGKVRTPENRMVLRRSESERRDYVRIVDEKEEEENEFSSMSNEELNKRVEEFIQRFNRQIRLQRIEASKF